MALSVISATLMGCDRDNFGSIGEALTLTSESLDGSWKLDKVIQVDEGAVAKGFAPAVQSEDITSAYDFKSYEISFTADEGKISGGFTVVNATDIPVMLPASGNWKFDDRVGTRKIKMVKAGGLAADTVLVEFGSAYRKSDGRLSLNYSRRDDDGKPFLTYRYSFVRK